MIRMVDVLMASSPSSGYDRVRLASRREGSYRRFQMTICIAAANGVWNGIGQDPLITGRPVVVGATRVPYPMLV